MEIADIYKFINQELDISKDLLHEDTDIFDVFQLRDDDCADFIEKFSAKFKVDLDGYLWYFHHGEAGLNIGSILVKPPYQRVKRIPITPEILLKAATKRRWKVEYPDHKIPQKRWDMVINKAIMFLLFFYILNRFIPLVMAKFS